MTTVALGFEVKLYIWFSSDRFANDFWLTVFRLFSEIEKEKKESGAKKWESYQHLHLDIKELSQFLPALN